MDRRTRTVTVSLLTAATLALAAVPTVARAQDDGSTTTTTPPTDPGSGAPASTVPDPATTTTTVPTTTTAPGTTTSTTTTTTTPAAPDTTVPDTTVPATTVPETTVPAAPIVVDRPEQVEYVLATIRRLESNGNYAAPPNKATASGAYQYLRRTWNNYAGYPDAYLAPAWVQDERAQADVEAILRRYAGDVSMVPVSWYYPAAARDPSLMDIVPHPKAGNVLTIRQYQQRWLGVFLEISGRPLPPRDGPLPPGLALLSGVPPAVPAAKKAGLELAFPLLGPSELAPPTPCETVDCPVETTAIVFGRQLQPVRAAADGVVTEVVLSDGMTGEVRITVTDRLGRRYTYAGLNDDQPGTDDGFAPEGLRVTALAKVGRSVRAGQVIGFLGNSDAIPLADGSGAWPHLRLTVTDVDGTPLDAAGAVVRALFREACTTGIGPWSLPVPREVAPGDVTLQQIVPVDDHGGAWTITATGQVLAVGDAALIHPTTACQWRPDTAFGPGGGGNAAVPDGFYDPIDLPIDVWVASGDAATAALPLAPMLRP